MHSTEIIGIIVLVLALGVQLFLTLWARSFINRVKEQGPGSARKLLKDGQREN